MKKKTIIGIVAAIAVVTVIAVGLTQNSNQKDQGTTVKVGTVKQEKIVEKLSTTGTLIPNSTDQLVGTGTVTDLSVKVGDKVTKDQILVTYDSGLELKSGHNGTVTEINIKEGQPDSAAQQGKASIVVADLSNLKVQLGLSSSEAQQVKVNQKAVISSGGHDFNGKVSEKDPVATATASAQGATGAQLGAEVTFDKAPENLYAGFNVDVDITTGTVDNALAIPIEALTYNEKNQAIVYRINDDKVSITKVQVGLQSDTLVEIKEGLKKDDKVVLSPASDLKDGSEVTVE